MRWIGALSSLLPVLLLLLLDGETVQGSPYPRPFPQTLRRLPRRNDYIAYNLHRTIRPRDVNELGVNQARKAMHDVHETIAEVQRLLALDPSLPRLTRGEIEELFENVTREEFAKSIRAGDHTRAQHMRALMLVLPYHANNMSPENLQQIYTRPPVTRIVGAADSSHQRPNALPVVGTTTATSTTTTPSPPAPPPAPVRTTMADLPVTTIRFTTPRPTTFHPTLPERMRDPGARLRPEELNDILSAIGLSQSPPSFRPMPTTTTTTTTTTTEQPTTTTPAPDTPISNSINVDDPKVAQELKELLRSFGLLKDEGSSFGSPTAPAGIESLANIQPSALVLHEPLRVEESLPTIDEPSASTTTTMTTTAASSPPVVDEEKPVTGGLTQAKVSPDDYIAFKPLPIRILGEESGEDTQKTRDAELDQLLQSFGLLSPGRSKKSMHRPEQQQQQHAKPDTTPPTMTAMPAIDADLVAPQLMSVLGTLGIQMRNGATVNQAPAPSPTYRHSVSRREKSGRKLEPPTSAAMLIGDASRKPVATSSSPTSSALFHVNNEDYNKLQQLWQAVKELEKLNVSLSDESLDVLNPKHYDLSPTLLAQGPDPLDGVEAQERLNEIKKRQQPGTATTADDDATVPVSDSPTRFNLDFDTNTAENDTPSSSSSAATPTAAAAESDSDAKESSTTTTTTSSTTTTESARNAALLEESFPSADLAGDPVNEEPLPPPRRTGFYFLYDWNTFLEVGEEPNKVIIRYNPKAGDPSRFLPVNVP
ncbi:mucin-5AC [Anopheles aquasalis]|uniref:mucin-5AC n=1 Tax=Anopheles aquasalis TaxID=42839 RepID=UPI00215AB4BC|nr:mucin-5AC [Anopheles aquasalis]XP_050081721.1 mucin-5AC [Anopheles aquasalis]XP_050081722.1 mucin-5AC [Anopheles aquasalis]